MVTDHHFIVKLATAGSYVPEPDGPDKLRGLFGGSASL